MNRIEKELLIKFLTDYKEYRSAAICTDLFLEDNTLNRAFELKAIKWSKDPDYCPSARNSSGKFHMDDWIAIGTLIELFKDEEL